MGKQAKVEFVLLPPRDMPLEIKEIFEAISQVVTRLHASHAIFKDLYGTQESVDLLNETAPGAFFMIGQMFRDDFIISASRLTDPKSSGHKGKKRDNLTFKQLIHVFKQHCTEKPLVAKLIAHEKVIAKHCENIRKRRNRVVAHLDLKAALKKDTTDPVPKVEQKEIDQFITMVSVFLNEIVGYYHRAHRDFNPTITGTGQAIVQCLKGFHRLRKLEMEWNKKNL